MSITTLNNDLLKELTNQIEKDARIVEKGIVNSDLVNRIPESLFVNYFLPYFTGERHDNPNWVLEWISVAGSPMSEVVVFDDGTKEDLYVVPSLFNTKKLIFTRGTETFKNIFMHFNRLNANIPGIGFNFLNEMLEKKTGEIEQLVDHTESIKQWSYILARYGYKQVNNVEPDNGIDKVKNLEDLFDF